MMMMVVGDDSNRKKSFKSINCCCQPMVIAPTTVFKEQEFFFFLNMQTIAKLSSFLLHCIANEKKILLFVNSLNDLTVQSTQIKLQNTRRSIIPFLCFVASHVWDSVFQTL